jgi:hypothetical protein
VSVRGVRNGHSTRATNIWSCSKYTEDGNVYEKQDHGVTLSQVVEHSKLVVLLSCCGASIMNEYTRQAGNKPDFDVFWREHIRHDVSLSIFLALLITSIKGCSSVDKEGDRDEVIRRNVCQVMLWVKEYGVNTYKFWSFLQTTGCKVVVVYYESRKREIKIRLMNEGRCDERLKTRVEESTCLTYTGLLNAIDESKSPEQSMSLVMTQPPQKEIANVISKPDDASKSVSSVKPERTDRTASGSNSTSHMPSNPTDRLTWAFLDPPSPLFEKSRQGN